jgi:hypothetical protein
MKARTAPNGMTPDLTLLFAMAGGAAVGNLYWAPPLLSSQQNEGDGND